MRTRLDRLASFRLEPEVYERYELAAAQAGTTLSKYLRDRLSADDYLVDQISQLQLVLLDNADSPPRDSPLLPILLELLLLIRRQTPPGDQRAVRMELERQGIAAWSSSNQVPS